MALHSPSRRLMLRIFFLTKVARIIFKKYYKPIRQRDMSLQEVFIRPGMAGFMALHIEEVHLVWVVFFRSTLEPCCIRCFFHLTGTVATFLKMKLCRRL